MSKRIVIFGGSGFVGRHLCNRLAQDGHELRVLTRNAAQKRDVGVHPSVDLVTCNVYGGAALADLVRGADVVINLVGILNESGFGGAGFRKAHVELTRSVLDACAAAGVRRLLQMSALNAGRGDSHYLKTRGEAEALVSQAPLAWTIFRPSVIFGPGDGLFCRFAAILKLPIPVLPLARASARFAPVYVGDVTEAFARAIDDPDGTRGKAYELGGPRVMTLKEIVTTTRDLLGLHRLVVPIPNVLGRLQALAMDFVPGKPFSTDNYLSLAHDSVPAADGYNLVSLGIRPTPIEAIVPYVLGAVGKQAELDHYRARRDF
jgi:uncharacterized protein YbjT (DUF2867 family)